MWGSPSRCGSRACGSRLPWTAARDAAGSCSPTCARPAAGARRAASPGSPGTPHPTGGGEPIATVPRATAGRPAGSGPGRPDGEDRVLVPEHQELGILGHLAPGQHRQAAQQTANEQVDDRNDHSAMIPAGKPVQARSSNRAPQVPGVPDMTVPRRQDGTGHRHSHRKIRCPIRGFQADRELHRAEDGQPSAKGVKVVHGPPGGACHRQAGSIRWIPIVGTDGGCQATPCVCQPARP